MRRLPLLALAAALVAGPAFAFDIQGHRGTRGLAPENTLPAFAKALSLGVTTLEFDINITADGHVLVGHDPVLLPTVTRKPDGTFLTEPGPVIRQTTLAELKRYDVGRLNPDHRYGKLYPEQQPVDGTRMPLLSEVFALVEKSGNKTVRFNIETKISPLKPNDSGTPEELAKGLVAEIRKAGLASRTTIQSFDWRTLKIVREIAPEIELVMLSIVTQNSDTVEQGKPGAGAWLGGLDIDDFGGSLPKAVKAAGGSVWSPFWRNATPENVAEAHALGLKVIPWTVNELADIAAVIDLKVDGIITDYPDRLRKVAGEKGIALPAPTPVSP